MSNNTEEEEEKQKKITEEFVEFVKSWVKDEGFSQDRICRTVLVNYKWNQENIVGTELING